MKTTNYAEKIRRRKQFLKQNKIKPDAIPKKSRTVWIWLFAGALISLIAVPLITIFSFALVFQDKLREEWLSYQNLMVIISFVGIALLLVIIWIAPKIYVKSLQSKTLNENQSEFDREKEKLKLEDDVRKTFAQLVGGAIFLFGILFTYNTFVLNREGQITDRYTKAVSQLGDQDTGIRLGALYSLERIAKDSPKDHWTIMEILSAYIHEKSPNKKATNSTEIDQKKQSNSIETKQTENEAVKTDIQAALTIIGRRKSSQDPDGSRIDLNSANLRRVNLFRADLKSVEFIGANLSGATFIGADLTGTKCYYTDLTGGNLGLANLKSADLYWANLTGANLINARFDEANLNGANFSGADLSGALNLTYEQIKIAIINENTKLPEYLESRRQELLEISKKILEERERRSKEKSAQ